MGIFVRALYYGGDLLWEIFGERFLVGDLVWEIYFGRSLVRAFWWDICKGDPYASIICELYMRVLVKAIWEICMNMMVGDSRQ